MMEKNKVNRWLGITLLLLVVGFAIIIMLQLSSVILGPSKKACTKKVCLAKFLEGPPAFNDETLKEYLWPKFFEKSSGPLKLTGVTEFDNFLDTALVEIKDKYFKKKRGGTFVVLGAGDGEYQDITLPLETELGWTGLLIEPHPKLYEKLKSKGRTATLNSNCVSPFTYPSQTKFGYKQIGPGTTDREKFEKYRLTKVNQLWVDDTDITVETYQCVPLENLVYASGIEKEIDLLVLDMSGTDLDILLNVRLDMMPHIEMIMVRSLGSNIGTDIGGFFLDNNMVVHKAIGDNAEKIIYLLKKFRSEDEL